MQLSLSSLEKSISVAPMLDLTDRHCRALFRILSPNAKLYTEMVVVGSIIHGDKERFLGYDVSEHPLALQLGGCDPKKLATCATLAEEWGYDEVNLNVGCPSDRVKNAQFGACLMASPDLVREGAAAMIDAVDIPVTVKTRLGIDNFDSYEYLYDFIENVAGSGCSEFIIHARKAWLNGLSPKENRTIPALMYDRVYQLKEDFPTLRFVLNGGVTTINQIENHLALVDGVMIGREIYQNPWLLRQIEEYFYGGEDFSDSNAVQTRVEAVMAFIPYMEERLSEGLYLRHMTRHMLGLFHGQAGAKSWRRYLSEFGPRKAAGIEVVLEALKFVEGTEYVSQVVGDVTLLSAEYSEKDSQALFA
jgi:tRNA-dihydrouridine synthase A